MSQKPFRIEQMPHPRRAHAPASAPSAHGADALKRELAQVHDALAKTTHALAALLSEGRERRFARAAGELGCAVEAMEKAVHSILQSAEAIDDCAKGLAATQMSECGPAQDIQEHIVRLYEACNFQDIAGQRIGKVIATLNLLEDGIGEAISRGATRSIGAAAPSRGLINGPRLDGDTGHASQQDIDTMFG